MQIKTHTLGQRGYPAQLAKLGKPPSQLYCAGRELEDILNRPRAAVVGTRNITAYGKQVTRDIVKRLVGRGVVIVSGLAYGVDAEAHQTALDEGGITMAVLPSPIMAIAPSGNQRLARHILASGGALVSTYPVGTENHKGNFVERNEYVAALSQVVIITEAGQGSGSRHTANFATSEQISIPVYAVPGSMYSPMSAGVHGMIAANRAAIYTNLQDVTEALGLGRQLNSIHVHGDSPQEQTILDLLVQGICDGQALLEQSKLETPSYNQTLTLLEISGKIRALGGNQWGIA